ncbi:MAG: hypothetical protein WC150_06065 [Bacteroidia bacterium]
MANFHIAFDHNNVTLGLYFEKSKADLINHINHAIPLSVVNEINSDRCNQAYIDIFIPTINLSNFIFVAYSHGLENKLTANGGSYIESDINSNLFTNCFFYSMSCLTGIDLGKKLAENNSHTFIGYNDFAPALLGKYMKLSIDCDNFAIKKFIDGYTIVESFNSMKTNFTAAVDYLENKGEPLLASALRKSRDALVLYGDSSLTIAGFHIN